MTQETAREDAIPGRGEYEQFISELFHQLSQPLTTLNCCLEISLQEKRAPSRHRRDLGIALQQAETVARLVAQLRELVDAGTPSGQREQSALDACLKEAVGDLLPVAQSLKVKLGLCCHGPLYVGIEASRLKHALFRLMEFALHGSRAGGEARITAEQVGKNAVLRMKMSASAGVQKRAARNRVASKQSVFDQQLALAVAARIFESAQGALEFRPRPGGLWIQVRLPMVKPEPALPLAWPSRCCG